MIQKLHGDLMVKIYATAHIGSFYKHMFTGSFILIEQWIHDLFKCPCSRVTQHAINRTVDSIKHSCCQVTGRHLSKSVDH